MIYLAKATLKNSKGEVIVSEIVCGQTAIDTQTLNDYQMRRALEDRGIIPKQKTKYDSWRDAKVVSVEIIKSIKGLNNESTL
jgi:hypothetical protein